MIRDLAGLLARVKEALADHTDLAVVGMSGGADSTLVATLCAVLMGRDRVFSVHMPATQTDLTKFNKNSLAVAKKLDIRAFEIPIGDLAERFNLALSAGLGDKVLSPLNQGNSRARLRMSCLYGVAHQLADEYPGKRVRVIGTGNLSEDFIGYDTKGGDALADYFVIGDLFKSEVYQLLDYFCDQGVLSPELIDRMPSAGLWDGQTDEAELGYSYNQMEPSVRKCLNGEKPSPDFTEIDHFVYSRHMAHKHKHEAPPVLSLRGFCS